MQKNCDSIDPLYIELYKTEIADQKVSRRTIAKESKLSHTTISNFLDGVTSPWGQRFLYAPKINGNVEMRVK